MVSSFQGFPCTINIHSLNETLENMKQYELFEYNETASRPYFVQYYSLVLLCFFYSGKRLNGNKPTRARTILTARQLHALRTCYMTNPKPDATTRSKLCQMTGLQPRVVRVWFQNKRCKDKRKAMQAMKKAEESQRKGSSPHSQSASVDHGSTILSSSNSGAQMPGSDGSCLPPLPSIPTITTAETDFRQNAINIIPVPSSCSQPKETFLHSLPSCNEVFTPNLPVNGCSFGDLQPVGPPKFSDTLSAYYQQQMFNAAPYQQSADCTPNWEDLLGHHQLFDDQPLPYSSHTTVILQ